MSGSTPTAGRPERHQHPLLFVTIFLVVAIGALVLTTATRDNADHGSGGTPGPDVGFNCERGTPEGFALSDVEGKTLSEVEQWTATKGWSVRVVVEDGQPKAATTDFRPDRVNVQTEAGTVTRYCGNG